MTAATLNHDVHPPAPARLSPRQQIVVLLAAFAAWMFAGLELSMFVLVGRSALIDLIGGGDQKLVGQWFTWYQAAVMLGAAAGGWVFGYLGDRFGRTRAMAGSILCYSVATGACALVTGPSQLLVLRFVTGMGIGGVWPNAVSLVAEAWPSASRPFLAGLLGTAANVGFVLLGAIGYVWPITSSSWRWVPLVGTAPIVLAVLVLLRVSESPQWLAGRRRQPSGADTAPAAASPLRQIFTPPLLKRTIIGILLGAIPVIGTSANGNWAIFWSDHHAGAADPQKKAVTQMLRSGGGILGSLLGGSVAALVGRRLTYFLISLFSLALSTWLFGMMHPHDRLFDLFTFLLGFVGITYFGWLPLFLPELFPTAARSTGTGVCFNSGRIIAAVVVLGASGLVAAFHGDFAKVGLWTGSIYALGMIIIWFAPVARAAGPPPQRPDP